MEPMQIKEDQGNNCKILSWVQKCFATPSSHRKSKTGKILGLLVQYKLLAPHLK